MNTIKLRFFISLGCYILGTLLSPLLGRDLHTVLLCTLGLGLAFILAITTWVLNIPHADQVRGGDGTGI